MSINLVDIFGGFVQGTAFSALYAGVDDLIAKNHIFRPLFKDIKSRLDTLKPLVPEMEESNQQLSYTNKDELKGLDKVLKVGEELVLKCLNVRRWDLYRKYKYATKLLEWEEHLKKELEVLQVQGIRDGKKTAVSVDQISSTLGEVNQMIKAKLVIHDHHSTAESKAWCAVPELPQLTVGLEAPLKELKGKILHDGGVSMIVVTAPGGCGKTTLATKFCQDQQVKDKFKDNIFFVTVSKKPSLDLIVQQLYRHKGSQQVPTNFHNELHAVQWLQTFLKEEGKKPLLLVLDDVWSGSESLLDKFQCRMTMNKILVTSRSEFPAFSSPYHLPLLGYEDAMKLFHHAASLGDKSSHIPPHLSKKIGERCKGFPLAITVVGRSLCGKPVEIWQKRVIEWSKGYLFLDSETDLLLSLQSSLDALDKENAIIKECFLDLGSFREDARISVNALIDMWAELYDLEETVCIANLYELNSRSLANLVDRRRVKENGDEGCYNEHWITQHDLLRELAIYHSKLEPVEQRKRLIIEIYGDDLPKWWREHNYQFVKARLLSISVDGELSTTKWPNMQLPETEALVLNLRKPKTYALPEFVEKMDKLKVLVVKNVLYSNTKLSNFQLLSSLTNLKRIRLESISIRSITENPLQLKSLQKISFFNCAISEAFTDSSFKLSHAFPNLEEVNFHASPAFWKFPADFCDLIYVKKLLFIKEILLSALPEEIGNLVNLEVLKLRASIRLSKLPDSIRNLKKLNFLGIVYCNRITELPKYIGEVKSLRKLDLRGCDRLWKLPESVLDLEQLEEVICDERSQKQWEPLLSSLKNKNNKLNIVAYRSSRPSYMLKNPEEARDVKLCIVHKI
ncbi:hypothetical protein M0R45_032845 [Rubus argutus]|uniref:RPW8 domain-containing protein n=1 Tax=Rubus argutus TaxID=59490 RepID=A0AAW1WLK1_RUBAR